MPEDERAHVESVMISPPAVEWGVVELVPPLEPLLLDEPERLTEPRPSALGAEQGGRPTVMTDGRAKIILTALSAGNTRTDACGYAGIHRDTFYAWVHKAPAFSDAVAKAEAGAAINMASRVVFAATNGTWQAAAWWLERRRPAEYALRPKVELSGPAGGPIEVVSGFDDHERRALRDVIRAELARRESDGGIEAPVDKL